jgi:beta-lactamase class A
MATESAKDPIGFPISDVPSSAIPHEVKKRCRAAHVRVWLPGFFRGLLVAVSLPHAWAAGPQLARLEREMERVSKIAGGEVGASAIHLETGRKVSFHGDERFPMASAFKIPIAVQLLHRIERGELQLDQMIELHAPDLHPGSGTLSDLFDKPGVALSVRNLMELMLLISDNSATDILLRLAGGPEAVTARMRDLGIAGINVNRSTARLIADSDGVKNLPPESQWSLEMWHKLLDAVPRDEAKRAAADFDKDPRDTATPEAMTALLARIWLKDREVMKPESAGLLLDIMRRCQTGQARLKGILPEGTEVAHKTGSIGGTTNDVGIVTLPENTGHVAIAVFVKASGNPVAARERAIAEIARTVHDFFLFETPPGALDYDHMAERVVDALKPARGERVMFGGDPDYFQDLSDALRKRLKEAGSTEVHDLKSADMYLWLPLSKRQVSAGERQALGAWLDRGGAHREIHFHWDAGSVEPDGLAGAHSAALDRVYQNALDIDYAALSAAQDRAIKLLRSGDVRVRTPAGTDIAFRVGNRPFNRQDGNASARHARAARVRVDREIELPAGVLRVAPIEESVNGVLVIPSARFPKGVVRNLRLEIREGAVTGMKADENLEAADAAISAGGDAAHGFREFALGFNPRLENPSGGPTLAYYGYGAGVVRMSLGDNEELGGQVRGDFVRWFFFPDATVEVNGRLLTERGKLVDANQPSHAAH